MTQFLKFKHLLNYFVRYSATFHHFERLRSRISVSQNLSVFICQHRQLLDKVQNRGPNTF